MPQTEYVLRRAVPGDEAELALLGQATFLESYAGLLPASDIAAYCQRSHAVAYYRGWLQDGVTQLWLAEASAGAAPLGYLALTLPDLPLEGITSHDREIRRVYLLHRFQGAGLGRALMEVARDEARAQGMRRLLLGVYRRNTGALAFYQRLGYRPVGERRFHVGANQYEDLILALALDTAETA